MTASPIDGYTISAILGKVTLTMSDRYGSVVAYEFEPDSAALVGAALITHAVDAQRFTDVDSPVDTDEGAPEGERP